MGLGTSLITNFDDVTLVLPPEAHHLRGHTEKRPIGKGLTEDDFDDRSDQTWARLAPADQTRCQWEDDALASGHAMPGASATAS